VFLLKDIDFMKTQNFKKTVLTLAAASGLVFLAGNIIAQDSTNPAQPAAASQAAPPLSIGVSPVLQMVQAKVGDSTVLAYVQNSGMTYRLSADQIIYLKQQGVSEAVLNAMLNQQPKVASTSAQTAPPPDNSQTAQTSTAEVQPATTYVQTVPSSTVYVIPDSQTYYYNSAFYGRPYYYPNYYPYYAWPYPAVSLSFGFGGGHYWGGGGHGGGFRGGHR
jgi:hypothetical protein